MGNWLRTLGCFLVVLSTSASAMTANQDDYLKAERLLKTRQYTLFHKALAQLEQHPLAPYLESRWIRRQFYRKPIEQIDQFLKQYKDEQPAKDLQKRWLSYLAKKQEWALFLSYYQPTANLTLRCHRIRALQNTKRQFDAIREGQELWLLGVSLPKACDRVYKDWKRHGYLSQDLIWQRLLNAKPKKQYKLVRYLKRKLDRNYLKKAKQLDLYWRYPQRVFSDTNAIDLTPQVRYLLLSKALKRAPEHLIDESSNPIFHDLDTDQIKQLRLIATKASALQSPENIFDWYGLAKKHNNLTDEIQSAFLQGALKKQNWPLYTHLYKLADSSVKQEPKWQYWQGRALGVLGAPIHQSRKYYEKAAVHRDFYGFLASQQIGISATMNHSPTHVPASVIQRMRLNNGVKRALALYELGRIPQARREWQTVFNQQTEEGKQALAIIAGRLEWPDRAIMSLAQIKSWHDLQLRFPLTHHELFEKAAQKNRINKNWIYGIARQESAFMHDARSPVGATGLMQIMPNTARGISKRLRISYSSKRLLDPSYNIKLGGNYLKYLLKRYDGNRVLATAAYNAGPGNVNRWLKRFQGPVDIWIEHIPFNETKEYVQRVLTYSTIYSYRLGYLQPILDDQTMSAWAQLQPGFLTVSQAKIKHNDKG